MNFVVITIIFAWGLYQTLKRGPAGAFVYAYMPVLLLLSIIRPITLPMLPDIFSPIAVTDGVLLGMLIKGNIPGFKIHPIDWMVLLASLLIVISGYVNGELWTIPAATGTEVLRWLVPYYMARLALREAPLRRTLAIQLCWIAMAISAMGLIEFRLWPLWFSRLLEVFGSIPYNDIVLPPRGGFFRAMVTCEHPIDLGNTGVLLAGLIPALAIAGGLRLRDWRVIGGFLASLAIIVESISFSSFMGLFVAIGLFAMLYYVRGSEYLLVPGVIAGIIAGFLFTSHLLSLDLEAIRPENQNAEQLEGSFWVRTLIVQNSWNSYGKDAGWVGWGDTNTSLDKDKLQLDSVDNSYMLFLMRRGWIYLSLRLVLAVVFAFMATRMMQLARTPTTRLPAAALIAVLIGIQVSMYTVWFGFVYAVLWTLMLAMTITMRQMLGEQRAAAQLPMTSFGLSAMRNPVGRPLIATPISAR